MTDETARVPVWCPWCEMVMKGKHSNQTFYNWGCCVTCFIQFIEGREDKIRALGPDWRPPLVDLEVHKRSLYG